MHFSFLIDPNNLSYSRVEQSNYSSSGGKGKGKSVPLQAWSGPDGSRRLSLPDLMTTAHEGGKVVSLTHRPPLPRRKCSWYSFLLEAES